MKSFLLLVLLFLSTFLLSQVPQFVNYQGVARTASGSPLPGTGLTLTLSISNSGGSYSEQHATTTNSVGLFSLFIGNGTSPSGPFSAFNWSTSPTTLNMIVDFGSGPVSLPSQQLVSVPYAFYADRAGSAPAPSVSFNSGTLSIGGNSVYIAPPPAQNLAINGNSLSITGGNTVTIPSASYTAGNGISISSGGVITNTLTDQTVVINGGTNVTINSAYPAFTVSSTPTLSISGASLSISGGNTVVLPTSGTVASVPYSSVTGTGAATVTSAGTNTFNVAVAQPSFSSIGSNTVSGSFPSYTITTPFAAAPVTTTITGSGVAAVSPTVGNNFNVNVPPTNMTFNGSNGVLSYSPAIGINTVNIIPVMNFTTGVLSLGGSTVAIPGTGLWSTSSGTAVVTTNTTNYVGIGTNNPLENVDIESTSSTRVSIISGASNPAGLYFGRPFTHNAATIIYDNNTNVLNINTLGFSNRFFVDPAGRIGFGTNAPAADAEVNGSLRLSGKKLFLGNVSGVNNGYTGIYENGGDLRLAVFNSSGGATPFGTANTKDAVSILNTSGFVGINTNAPTVPLEVNNMSGQVGLQVNGNDPNWSSIYVNSIPGASPGFGYLQSGILQGGHWFTPGGDWYLTLNGTPRIHVLRTNGYVGIGTNNPTHLLELNSNSSAGLLRLKTNLANTQITMDDTGANDVYLTTTIGNFDIWTGGTQRLTVQTGGNVGIRTTSPTADLEVNGFTKLGSTAPAVKMHKITGTSPASQGSQTSYAIPAFISPTKILSVTVMVEWNNPGDWIQPGYTINPGYEFQWYTAGNSVFVATKNANSNFVIGKPVQILITYEP